MSERMDEQLNERSEGRRITDELRVCARTFIGVWVDSVSQTITFTTSDVPPTVDSVRMDSRLLAIADRIDNSYEEMHEFCERLLCAATKRDDVTLWGVDYAALPVDADGKPIHVGDMLMDGLDRAFAPKKVKMLMLEGNEWMLNFGGGWCAMKHHEWHHHTPDTWERIIEDAMYCDQTLYEHDPDAAVDFANSLVERCKALAGDAK